jgi:protein TonB
MNPVFLPAGAADSTHHGRQAMFEDSTFESTGRIRTRSRGWAIAALALNSSILLAIIVIPLIHPEALPRQAIAFLMALPPPPSAPPQIATHQAARASGPSTPVDDPFTAPTRIPPGIRIASDAGPEPSSSIGSLDSGNGVPDGIGNAFHPQPQPRVIHPEPKTAARLPSSVAEGLLIYKPLPQYSRLAITMHAEGTVVLAATISTNGTITNLRVVSGPAVLQQSAVAAVSNWRYRPYMLNGQPVEVETTVNVVFKMGD